MQLPLGCGSASGAARRVGFFLDRVKSRSRNVISNPKIAIPGKSLSKIPGIEPGKPIGSFHSMARNSGLSNDLSHPTSTPTPTRIPVIGRPFPVLVHRLSLDGDPPLRSVKQTLLVVPADLHPPTATPSNPPGMSGLPSFAQGTVARTPPANFRGTVPNDARRALHPISSISSTLSSVVSPNSDGSISASAPLAMSIEFNGSIAIGDIMDQVQGQIQDATVIRTKANEDNLIAKWVTVSHAQHRQRPCTRPPHAPTSSSFALHPAPHSQHSHCLAVILVNFPPVPLGLFLSLTTSRPLAGQRREEPRGRRHRHPR